MIEPDNSILVIKSNSKPYPNEFSDANRQGVTKIVVSFLDSEAEIRWQFFRGQWRFVKRWRKQ